MTDPSRVPARPAEAGFTLIELMITLVILTIGLLAMSAVQTRSSNAVYSTGRQTRALALAQDRLEFTRSRGYVLAASDSGVTGPFTWNARVDSVSFELKQIVVTVSWAENLARPSLQLNTLLSAR